MHRVRGARSARRSCRALDPGAVTGRGWVDFNGDGRADYCRVLASTLGCSPSTGSAFAGTANSFDLDVGFAEGRAWADVNGDGRADYCRRIGSATNTLVRCTLATGAGFGSEVTSGRIEWGAEEGTAWVDFEGDGDRDFCRPIGASVTTAQLFCTLWPGLAHTVTSSPVDLGYGTDRAWVDHNGDGRADYCRRVGDAPEQHAHLLHDLQRHRLRPAAVRAARADPHPDAEPRAARRATRRAAEADRDLPALGQELEPHVDALQVPARDRRAARRDRHRALPEGLLAQVLHEAQRARHGLAEAPDRASA